MVLGMWEVCGTGRYVGLRASRRKNEDKKWETTNTIDLIKVILESWGCGMVKSTVVQCFNNC